MILGMFSAVLKRMKHKQDICCCDDTVSELTDSQLSVPWFITMLQVIGRFSHIQVSLLFCIG